MLTVSSTVLNNSNWTFMIHIVTKMCKRHFCFYTGNSEKLIFSAYIFTDLFCKDFSSLVRIIFSRHFGCQTSHRHGINTFAVEIVHVVTFQDTFACSTQYAKLQCLFHASVSSLQVKLIEKLLNNEKHQQMASPVNCYRKYLGK